MSLYALSAHVCTDTQQPGWTRSLTCVDQDPPRLPGPHGPAWAGGMMERGVCGCGGCRVSGFPLEPFFPLRRRRWPWCCSAPESHPALGSYPAHGRRENWISQAATLRGTRLLGVTGSQVMEQGLGATAPVWWLPAPDQRGSFPEWGAGPWTGGL